MTQFVEMTLIPIIKQYEAEFNRKLLTQNQRARGYYFKFNINGLMRGDTASRTSFYAMMIRNGIATPNELRKLEDYYGISFKSNSTSDNCVTLDYYPNVFGSCGCGCMVFDESKEKISVAKDMIMNYSPNKVYGVMSAVGCSMSPKIEDGDKLVVEKWNGEQIKDNRVYLFRYNDELFIKRLVKNIDQIICISENPRFEDRIITDLKNFCLVGEIVGLWRERM